MVEHPARCWDRWSRLLRSCARPVSLWRRDQLLTFFAAIKGWTTRIPGGDVSVTGENPSPDRRSVLA
jgi:hypothetical protein